MRIIKLPELLIDVDNDLKFTRHFMAISQLEKPSIDNICAVLATIMAHGCNIGTYTMSHLIEGVSYSKIKHISDWLLTEESLRSALASIVNAIANLDITKHWGEGKTSSSDGQREKGVKSALDSFVGRKEKLCNESNCDRVWCPGFVNKEKVNSKMLHKTSKKVPGVGCWFTVR